MTSFRSLLGLTDEVEVQARIAELMTLLSELVNKVADAVDAVGGGWVEVRSKLACKGYPPLGYSMKMLKVIWVDLLQASPFKAQQCAFDIWLNFKLVKFELKLYSLFVSDLACKSIGILLTLVKNKFNAEH